MIKLLLVLITIIIIILTIYFANKIEQEEQQLKKKLIEIKLKDAIIKREILEKILSKKEGNK